MSKKRPQDGFNLAFLDVMACGLGAVLLILIVVKFSADTPIPSEQIERLNQELAGLQNQASNTQKSIDEVNDKIAAQRSTEKNTQQHINDLNTQQDAQASALANQLAVIADLENAIAAAAPEASDDLIDVSGAGEEKYLLGLKIEGKHIGIMVDTSASMTDVSLLEIIKRKIQGDEVKKRGPKWQRTLRTIQWMIARLPKGAKVSVVAFNSEAQTLGAKPINDVQVAADLNALISDLQATVPQNGTNLQLGLIEIAKVMPQLTNLYVITDGLPTLLSAGSGFKSSRTCKPSDPSQKTITGQCRFAVFQHSFARFAPRVETSVVLLPLEGDTQAASAYWNWANATGGLMISPAGTWP